MINTRLTGLLAHGKKYIAYNVLWQWISLLAQIGAVFSIADILGQTAALLKNESAFLIWGKDIAEAHTGSTLMILALAQRSALSVSGSLSGLLIRQVRM